MIASSNFLIIEDSEPEYTVGDLINRFYAVTILRQSELKGEFKGRKIAINPQVIAKNPAGWEKSESSISDEIRIAVYYRGYFVRIAHGKSLFGPHLLQLWFQIRPGHKVWLATDTHKFMWFDDDALTVKLKKSIRGKRFYCSPKERAKLVSFAPIAKSTSIEV